MLTDLPTEDREAQLAQDTRIYRNAKHQELRKYSAMAMQGLLVNDWNQGDIEAQAVSYAKNLIKQLDKEIE